MQTQSAPYSFLVLLSRVFPPLCSPPVSPLVLHLGVSFRSTASDLRTAPPILLRRILLLPPPTLLEGLNLLQRLIHPPHIR